jgi:hypothetical protein
MAFEALHSIRWVFELVGSAMPQLGYTEAQFLKAKHLNEFYVTRTVQLFITVEKIYLPTSGFSISEKPCMDLCKISLNYCIFIIS